MISRRKFLVSTALASLGTIFISKLGAQDKNDKKNLLDVIDDGKPIVISTWQIGLKANETAWKILQENRRALDAVEQGVRIPESDPEVTSVGLGGNPDRDGNVTVDASIMDENGNCGSVAFLQHIKNPVSVARLVMEKTPHIMLAGEGALQFALQNGFKKENLLTEKSKQRWEEWKRQSRYQQNTQNNHDTIGMLAIDKAGNISGACTTSGFAYKYHGRVGDSPIIGAGLYVDNEIGGASATGMGEVMMKTLGSFLIVELMRNGKSPQEACEEAVIRAAEKNPNYENFSVSYIAVNKNGETGAYGMRNGFEYALCDKKGNNRIIKAKSYLQ